MEFYNSYTDKIKDSLKMTRQFKSTLNKSHNYQNFSGTTEALRPHVFETKQFGLTPEASLLEISNVLKLPQVKTSKIGEHPDFLYLKNTNKTENHYITSVFIDIVGSTNLFRKYELEEIYTITNIIQSAAIHTCLVFGGYIQRLQGDGVFVYFGGRGIDKSDSVKLAIAASSFFSYFVKYDIKRAFEQEGIENIYTRIGIDFGDDDKVLWANFGLGQCSELTTLSLHTSLASKMQAKAQANGIVLGDNVKILSKMSADLFSFVSDSSGNIDRYIFRDPENSFYYTQYQFNWHKFIANLPHIKEGESGELVFDKNMLTSSAQLSKLKETAALINSGNAYTDRYGVISNNPSGIKNQEHRFHYEAKLPSKKV